METKEAAWRAELNSRLEEERCESERRLAQLQQTFEAIRSEERQTWQQRLDVLVQKTAQLLADKERLEKNIRQEVDARVQVKKTHQFIKNGGSGESYNISFQRRLFSGTTS